MIRPHQFRSVQGFTLIELLLAITIFAVVLTAVNGVFYGALKLRNRTTGMVEKSLPTQHAIATLRRDLAGIVGPGSSMIPSFRTGAATMNLNGSGGGQDQGFEFYTSTGNVNDYTPWGDIQKVSYVLRQPTNNLASFTKELVRLVSRNLLQSNTQEAPAEEWIMSNVQSLEFSFYDGSQWRTTWDSTTEQTVLPKAVKVEIGLGVEPDTTGVGARPVSRSGQNSLQIIVPVFVSPNTNQTSQTSAALTVPSRDHQVGMNVQPGGPVG